MASSVIGRTATPFLISTLNKSTLNTAARLFSTSPNNYVPYNGNVRVPSLLATARITASTEKVRKWSRRCMPMTLTYYTFPTENTVKNLSSEDIKSAFRSAFARWSEVIPVDFAEVENPSEADINIGFHRGDEYPFNEKKASVLASAEYPRDGEETNIYMNAEKIWAVDFKKEKSSEAYDLESVAVHEIGHVLGLDHSKNKEAVMSSGICCRSKRKLNLRIEDAKRAQELYGSRPNFDLNILERRLWFLKLRRGFHEFFQLVIIFSLLMTLL